MFQSLLDVFFGCSHRRTTFPQTPAHRRTSVSAQPGRTYVVCLDCGKELNYNWTEMRVGDPVAKPVATTRAESYSLNR